MTRQICGKLFFRVLEKTLNSKITMLDDVIFRGYKAFSGCLEN